MAILARASCTLSTVRDVASTTRYYKLQSSTASKPAKPTTNPPSGWTTTEPSYTEGSTNSLYFTDLTVFTDGDFAYSDVSLSSSYEAAKQAYNKAVIALDAATPIATKTYSGLIGSADDSANASFYFAKIHPTSYAVQWKVQLRISVTAPEAYSQSVDIQLGGYGSSFSSYDSYTVRNSLLGICYINLYRATHAGISTNKKGHALGVGLRSSTNPTTASAARTIKVELLSTENCTVGMLDTAVKYAALDGTGSTNYYGLTEVYVATAGQNATNNTNTHYTVFSNAVKAGSFGVKRYTLLMKDTDTTWVSFVNQANSIATTKTVSTQGHILGKVIYSYGGTEYASGVNTSTVYDVYSVDLRYSTNCGTTLTAYRPVYLVGTIGSDGLFYLDQSQWWTQTIPTTEDGKTYIYIGEAYSSYQIYLATDNLAYQYYQGEFMTLEQIETAKAQTAANNAMTAANGKNKVFHQATAPATSAGLTAGDIWFDTSNDYKMSRWTGSAWTEEQFGESAIADASIGNAKIKDASIEHAKIKSLDMGKATVGKLKAQYLDVDDLFAQNITATGTITGATLSGGSLVISGYYDSDIVAVSEGGVKLSREIVWYDDNDEDHIEVRPLAALEWPGDAANVGLVLYTGDANDNPSTAFFAGGTIVFERDFGHVADNNPMNNVVMSKSGIYRIRPLDGYTEEYSDGYKAVPIVDFNNPLRVCRGTTPLITAPANGYKDVDISFPDGLVPDNYSPTVLCSLTGNAANGKYGYLSAAVVANSLSETGCTLRLYNADASSHAEYISWIAVYC